MVITAIIIVVILVTCINAGDRHNIKCHSRPEDYRVDQAAVKKDVTKLFTRIAIFKTCLKTHGQVLECL